MSLSFNYKNFEVVPYITHVYWSVKISAKNQWGYNIIVTYAGDFDEAIDRAKKVIDKLIEVQGK